MDRAQRQKLRAMLGFRVRATMGGADHRVAMEDLGPAHQDWR